MSATSILSGLDRLRVDSAQVDGGMTRVLADLARLRADARAQPASAARVHGDVTDIRGGIADLGQQVSAFQGAATELRAALRATAPDGADAATGSTDPVPVQARAAADAASRHAMAAEAGLNRLSGEFSSLQRSVPKL